MALEQIPFDFEDEEKKDEVKKIEKSVAKKPESESERELRKIRERNKGKPTKVIEDPFLR